MIKPLYAVAFSFLSFQVLAESVEQQLVDCSQLKKASLRLVCFDTVTSTIKAEQRNQGSAAIPQPSTTPSQPAATQPEFGFEQKVMTKTPEKILSTVISLKKGPYGSYTVNLENGQIWKQSGSEKFRLKTGDAIYIKKGALGSFLLGKEGKNKKIRVKRIK